MTVLERLRKLEKETLELRSLLNSVDERVGREETGCSSGICETVDEATKQTVVIGAVHNAIKNKSPSYFWDMERDGWTKRIEGAYDFQSVDNANSVIDALKKPAKNYKLTIITI